MRILTDRERAQLTRKPSDLEEAGGVAMSDARLAELREAGEPIVFASNLASLNWRIADARRAGFKACEFLAVDPVTSAVYVVNTEGSDYARYLGQAR